MNLCKEFARKFPIVTAILSMVFLFGLLKLTSFMPRGPLSFGTREMLLAILMIAWTFLFMGKEKLSFKKEGFRYGFRLFRNYLVIMSIFSAIYIGTSIYSAKGITSEMLTNLLNMTLAGAAVGFVEELSFRGLVFGGILQKLGNSKKGIIIAALVSGFLFGIFHVIGSLLNGEVSSWDTILTAALKTCQTGIFGVILAFVYYHTKNIFVIVALHCLDDYILFLMSAFSQSDGIGNSYVGVAGQTGSQIVVYIIFTLIMVPILVKSIKDIKEKEVIPFDEEFEPRAVKFEKKSKLKLA